MNVVPSIAGASCERGGNARQAADRDPLRRGQRDLHVRVDPDEPGQHPSAPSPALQGRTRHQNQLGAGPYEPATCHRKDIQRDQMLDRQQIEVDDHGRRLVGETLQQGLRSRGIVAIDSTPISLTMMISGLLSSTSKSSKAFRRSVRPTVNQAGHLPQGQRVNDATPPPSRPFQRLTASSTIGRKVCSSEPAGTSVGSSRLGRGRPRAAPSPGGRTARGAR